MRALVRTPIELRKRAPLRATNERSALGSDIDDRFEQICEIEMHRPTTKPHGGRGDAFGGRL
jgi:hypothetical protein